MLRMVGHRITEQTINDKAGERRRAMREILIGQAGDGDPRGISLPTANATIVFPRRPLRSSSSTRLASRSSGSADHFAGGYLFLTGAVIAQLANAKSVLRSHRRPKDAAGHGTRRVQIARPSHRIEHRTGLVIPEVFEALRSFLALVENRRSRDRRGNPVWSLAIDERARVRMRAARAGSVGFQVGEPLLQTSYVELIDGEDADAALRAPKLADQPIPLRRAVSARAASTIWTSCWSPGGS